MSDPTDNVCVVKVRGGQSWRQRGDGELLHVLAPKGRGVEDDLWLVSTEGVSITLTGDDIRLGYELVEDAADRG